MPLIIFRYLSELSQKRSLFSLLLFQIFPEVSQSHISLLQEGIVHGEGCPHALWLMALLGKLQIFAEHRAIVWMSTVFDDFLGTVQRTMNSLFVEDATTGAIMSLINIPRALILPLIVDGLS